MILTHKTHKKIIIFIFLLIMVPVAGRQAIATPLSKVISNQKYIQEKFHFVINGMERHQLRQDIQKCQQQITTARKQLKTAKTKRNAIKTARQIKRHQAIIIQKLGLAYQSHTKQMRKFYSRQYSKRIRKNQKALNYFRLALQEENRAIHYLRIRHPRLAIHTFRLARAYYFRAIHHAQLKPNKNFELALEDLKTLPKSHRPPQL